MSSITVVTPSIHGREELLAKAVKGVGSQTHPPHEHLIRVTHPPHIWYGARHIAEQYNALLERVETEWMCVHDDDDWWMPHHLETVESAMAEDVDFIRTYPANCEACLSVCLRVSTVRSIGGYARDFDMPTGVFKSTGATFPDKDLYMRLDAAGAKTVVLSDQTWHYGVGPWVSATRPTGRDRFAAV